ncbi:MAG: aminomethyl-transferring glycine dehydrogenase subunit GcvPA [Anaerolineaceae bacterium]|nr:aminomethyl-transferring glycine dehydrogenase subunit GcvPA [Anaerolineaceae bacterium]MDE0329200.1 aminomethyl-transferring glycine dehydrogenase subunit GcvPA [Anaerolineaceae bacterium]
MSYVPHTETERQQMLATIGVSAVEDLFGAVPARHRFPTLDLPDPLSELEVQAELLSLSEANDHGQDFALFRGGGAWHHYIPSALGHMLLRGEFLTAYTPYQPELSQGTLQAIFEYQSMICALTGMDAANASHYDGATSFAEAVSMAVDVGRGRRNKILFSPWINPQYRDVARTYHQGRDLLFRGDESASTLSDLVGQLDNNTAMLAVAYPDFIGHIADFQGLAQKVHEAGALLVFVVNPVALGLLKSPGELGADIVVGEGQPLGIPLSFGGPYVGFFATRTRLVRKIAGRIVGETVDEDGRRAWVMTLRPREQDIRREKASSNICTNQGLMALAAAVYLALMGKQGLRQVAELCWHKAHYAAAQIAALEEDYQIITRPPFFHEFALRCPRPVSDMNAALRERGIIGGHDLGTEDPRLRDCMLLAFTEMNSREEIDALVAGLRELQGS